MSENSQQSGGRTGSKQRSAQLVQRRARARSHPEDMPIPEPSQVDISLDADAFFDDDGNIPRVEDDDGETRFAINTITSSDDSESVASLETRLRRRRPDVVVRINEKTDDGETTFVGETKRDLIKRHITKLFSEHDLGEPNFEGVPITDDDVDDEQSSTSLDMTIPQEPDINRFSTMEDVTLSLDDDDDVGATCPECGSNHVSSYQQQTASADEGMTSFNKCIKCGHSWRGGY